MTTQPEEFTELQVLVTKSTAEALGRRARTLGLADESAAARAVLEEEAHTDSDVRHWLHCNVVPASRELDENPAIALTSSELRARIDTRRSAT